ncbi:hypothetical protein RIF29_32381 [Crotalaria pallida]|uniref:Uncharacterized protein n=1 Tax=Crotalaria pallida TaxID=3830 RepID=A0AAN9EKD7_CROPI
MEKLIDQASSATSNIPGSIGQLAHEYCNKSDSFKEWRMRVLHETEAFRENCTSNEQIIAALNNEREQALELLWSKKQQVYTMGRERVAERINWRKKKAHLMQEIRWKREQLAESIKAFQDLQKKFEDYVAVQLEPIEEPDWLAELIQD